MRVLIYVESWGTGGIESYLMGLLRGLSGTGFDFLLFTVHDRPSVFDSELASLGVERRCVFPNSKPGQVTRLARGLREFDGLIRQVKPDVTHVNTMNGMGFAYAWVARLRGVPVRIVHSHNTDVGKRHRRLKRLVGKVGRALFCGSATTCLACSEEAGRYLFGDRDFRVVRNGIDTRRFAFSRERRRAVRKTLGIPDDALLLGNPSRLAPAKSPLFQLEIFAEVLKREPTAMYLLLSGGEMAEEVDAKIEDLRVGDSVVQVVPRPDPEAWYCALDALIFPSLYEGAPIIPIEAQCCGLPVLASDSIPLDAGITDLYEPLSLELDADVWAERALGLARADRDRMAYCDEVRRANYDVIQTAKIVGELYAGLEGDHSASD